MTCLKCFHIFSVTGLPPALRFLWAGVSVSDMAAAVAISRTAANYSFRPDCLCETSFALIACAKLVSHVSPAWGRRRRPCETFRTVSQCESFAFRTTHWQMLGPRTSGGPVALPGPLIRAQTVPAVHDLSRSAKRLSTCSLTAAQSPLTPCNHRHAPGNCGWRLMRETRRS